MTQKYTYHNPVLLKETLGLLLVNPVGTYLDGTLGGGGHFRAIADKLQAGATLIGVDRDPEAIEFNKSNSYPSGISIILEQSRYSDFDKVLKKNNISALHGVILDLGVSSRQIDISERGFSYMQDSALDMRMNPEAGMSAEELLETYDAQQLTHVLKTYGEVQNAQRMAGAIKKCISSKPIRTSGELKQCLSQEYGPNLKIKVLAKIFQALRIAVNDELGELERFLDKIPSLLTDGGRLAVISYHSLEDRIVKNFIRNNEGICKCPPQVPMCTCGKPAILKRVIKKSVQATEDEIKENPRSRSARLRVAEKVAP